MKVAIAGAGMSGSYMYRLLKEQGQNADIYDIPRSTRCGIHSCAWGAVPASELRRLVGRFLEPSDYQLMSFDSISIEGLDIPADLLIIDKPRLVTDLLDGAEIRRGPLNEDRYDRVIDATGVARALLGPTIGQQHIADCAQYRVRTEEKLPLSIKISSLGYEWCFPLGENEYHLGFGNIWFDAGDFRPSAESAMANGTVLCKCRSKVRLSGPYSTRPFIRGKVVGTGESIGAVAPLASDGIIYAMQTSEMLHERWDDPEKYASEVLHRYEWMVRERSGLDRMKAGHMPTLSEIGAFLKHTRTAGLAMRMKHAMFFFRRLLNQ